MQNLLNDVKKTRVMAAQAAGTTSVEGEISDMSGFEGIQYDALYGTLSSGAVTGLKVQQGDLPDGSDMDDLEGSAQSIAEARDNDVLCTDIYRPTKRYVRPVVTRSTGNAVIDGVMATQYGARVRPVTHDSATIAGAECLASPPEGTA